jgi:damage-control phosphatase, subfamily I
VKPEVECGLCLMHWVYSRVAPHNDEEELPGLARRLLDTLLREIAPSANMGSLCNQAVTSIFDSPSRAADHYEKLKRQSNKNAKALLPRAKAYIDTGKTPRNKLERACFLAAASNVAPLNSPSGAYTFQEIKEIIDRNDRAPVVMGDIYRAVRESKHILYITDNAGEIGFDSLVIALIRQMGPKVTLVVKKKTFFEDATSEDARFFGLDKAVDRMVMADGFFTPHGLPHELHKVLEASDLVICKGTGSYEALHGEIVDKKTVYILKVKCRPIARELHIEEGTIVVKSMTPKKERAQTALKGASGKKRLQGVH